jgi:L-lactate dehydrogenase
MPDTSKQTRHIGSAPVRVVVVGTGHVGSTFAYTLLLRGLASEIVLVDVHRERAKGEAMDLNHAVPFGQPTSVRVGDYSDCAEAAVTVITAGVAQKPGESRLDLVKRNAAIFDEIIPAIDQHDPQGHLVITSNPVDVLTWVAQRLSSLEPSRVIGSGTVLDTARFRYLLGQHYDVDPRNVHAYIVGEHGDSEVPAWSLTNIAGMRLPEFCAAHGVDHDQCAMDELFEETRRAAYEIIERKGSTHYAIAAGLFRIVEAIVRDQRSVLTVSTRIDGYAGIQDVCLSLPCVIGQNGVQRRLDIELSDDELEGLRNSARVLREIIEQLDVSSP